MNLPIRQLPKGTRKDVPQIPFFEILDADEAKGYLEDLPRQQLLLLNTVIDIALDSCGYHTVRARIASAREMINQAKRSSRGGE